MIAGLQKMTLLDYPHKVACTVFLQGCNFRCPFCHNSSLLGPKAEMPIPEEELLLFLKKRQGILDGVCITGGEPTLYPQLPDLLGKMKALGYAVKLDTNGSRPEVLKNLVQQGLVDYVAMDIKNSPICYGKTAGAPHLSLGDLEESMAFLIRGQLPYEFRTTVVQELHSKESILEMGQWFQKICPEKKPEKIYLQNYTDRDSVLCGGLHRHHITQLQDFSRLLSHYVHAVEIRGVEQ